MICWNKSSLYFCFKKSYLLFCFLKENVLEILNFFCLVTKLRRILSRFRGKKKFLKSFLESSVKFLVNICVSHRKINFENENWVNLEEQFGLCEGETTSRRWFPPRVYVTSRRGPEFVFKVESSACTKLS